jgi:adenylate cyclase
MCPQKGVMGYNSFCHARLAGLIFQGLTMARLIRMEVEDAGGSRNTYEVADALAIGRSPSNQVVLDDQKVSRRHAEIRQVAPGRYRITDLGSANGTWINQRRLSTPCDLHNGDLIQIGTVRMCFEAEETLTAALSCVEGTATQLQDCYVVVLVTDIRHYTAMSESLPREPFSKFVRDWFKECVKIVESNQGTIDKFIGDAVMCYWMVANKRNPAREIEWAFAAAREIVAAAGIFATRMRTNFPGNQFQIGVGLSMGNALRGNVGTAANQSITLVGDSVNIAFRLEALTQELHYPVLASGNMARWMSAGHALVDLGPIAVKGRKKPVSVSALELDQAVAGTAGSELPK